MTLAALNSLSGKEKEKELTHCCGSSAWVAKMLPLFPFASEDDLFRAADDKWNECTAPDFLEAFTHHPKIGDIESLAKKFASTAHWAAGEQSGAAAASREVLEALAKGNEAYEQKFGYIFIVCATGKSAEEMLAILESRLPNDPAQEIMIAANEQARITQLRLKKLLL